MTALTLQQFLAPGADFEAQQYRVLHVLTQYRQNLRHEYLYPGLAELIEVYHAMSTVMQSQEVLEASIKQRTGSQGQTNPSGTQSLASKSSETGVMFQLIRWALPIVRELIDEGAAMFSFIEENVNIEEVGIIPVYRDEGYFVIPERRSGVVHVYRFQTSIYQESNEMYRALKTNEIQTVRESVEMTPERIKQELLEHNADLPNPVVYYCKTDLDFPFEESVLPVAKRKLMSYMYARAS